MQFSIDGCQYEIISNIMEPESLWVQAREINDLERLFPGVRPQPSLNNAYPFRVNLPRVKVARELARRVAGIVPGGVPTLCTSEGMEN